ncbi:MAG: acyltransferase [Acidimicrobiales bacterium]|nr:acyltransferase [Acidimicrobiales bacterium]
MEGPGSTPYVPALDGLRGVAVAAVLAFHGGFGWATGGFLGVSTFFTLSGFLITTVLLVEHDQHGRVGLRRFWSRRFRRLLPASLLCLAGVVVFGATVATAGQLAHLRVQVLAALADVANWQLIVSGTSYADLFAAPSPTQHFWSLAIEEQFYLLYPVAMIGLFAVARRTGDVRRTVAVGLGLAVAGSLLATALLQGAAVDRIYYGTDTRSAELTLGALLAVALHRRHLDGAGRRLAGSLGLAALAVTVVAWSRVDLADAWLYRGGLTAFALVSAALVAGAVHPGTAVSQALAWEPLRRLGLISYGVYLFHWPIFLWLTPERTGLGTGPLFVLRVLVTVGAAVASYALLERPVRARRVLAGREALVLAPAAALVVVVGAVVVTVPGRDAEPTFEEAQALVEAGDFTDAPVADLAATPPPADLAAAGRPEIALYGDSTALRLGLGFGGWVQASGLARGEGGVNELGCGLLPDDHFTRFRYDGEADAPDTCASVDEAWAADIAATDPDIALLVVGPWEVADWRDEDTGEWVHLGQPAVDDLVRRELDEAVDILSAGGAVVYLLTSPLIRIGTQDGVPPAFERPASDPSRMARFNAVLAEVADARPGEAAVVDLAGYLRSTPGGEMDPTLRPDGIHLTWDAATAISTDWLGPEILRRYLADRGPVATTAPATAATGSSPTTGP